MLSIHLPESFPGDWSVVVPPLPIPNREVKRDSADDSGPEADCESRSLPGNFCGFVIQ